MFRPFVALAILVAGATLAAQPGAGTTAFPLTVDSIMRGPDLVGYPPDNLRWSGDSQRLYFDWRKPGDDIAATWVVARAGGEPRRLSDEERLTAPLATGQWDRTRRRQLGVDEGDIVIIDTIAGRRVEVARTVATESAPRWAHDETAVTFVRDNNLFLAPLGPEGGGLVQLTDVAPRRPESRVTDSQRTARQEETDILDWVEQEQARRERRETRTARRLPARFELGERQSINDAALSKSGEPGFSADPYLEQRAVADTSELDPVIDRVLEANPGQVAAFRGGKEGLLGLFVGQVMNETGGKANARVVNERLREKLAAS